MLPAEIGYRALLYQNPIWKQLVDSWHSITYFKQPATIKQSATSSVTTGSIVLVMKSGIDNMLLEEAYNALSTMWDSQFDRPNELFAEIQRAVESSHKEPLNPSFLSMQRDWGFKGFHYSAEHLFLDEQFRLLIFEDHNQMQHHANDEKDFWETLKRRHNYSELEAPTHDRTRSPEGVRHEVWRRDGGKCARCGSRENLEFDHIVPFSKGGISTVRNIELLCETCNRSKSANFG